MYLEYFKLKAFPFSLGCDERFFYKSATHTQALSHMLYAIEQRKGMVLVTGDVGAGKTFLGSLLVSRLGKSVQAVRLAHPPDSGKQLVRAIAEGFGVKVPRDDDKQQLFSRLAKGLERLYHRRRVAVTIIDEAQDLGDQAMRQVRLIWNLERDGQRLMQFVLIGQAQLRERLGQPQWESLQQRVAWSYHLAALGAADTAKYVLHRRRVAAANGTPLRFTARALESVYQATGGIPRLINALCDEALLTAYARDTVKITSGIISDAAEHMTWCMRHNLAEAGQATADE